MLKKISNGCVHIVQRYLPDPFIFCILLTIVVFIAAIPAAGARLLGHEHLESVSILNADGSRTRTWYSYGYCTSCQETP